MRWAALLLSLAFASPASHARPSVRVPSRSGGVVRCAASAPVGPRLLLVEGQESMRVAVQRYFAQRGFQCHAVSTQSEALETLSQWSPPDLLITEVFASSSSADGLDLLRTVRTDAKLCGMPVVLLTSRGLTSDRIAGYSAGASAYVTKPFDPEELVAVVRAQLQNALLARQAADGGELRELRAEMASMRQLLQAVLVSGGSVPQYASPVAGDRGAPPQLPSTTASGRKRGSGSAEPQQELELEQQGQGQGQRRRSTWPIHEVPKLTKREISVLELVGDGKLNKEIASQLGVGLRYVEKIVRRLLEKTHTPNRTALVRRALQMGLISDDPDLPLPNPVFEMGGTRHPQLAGGAPPRAALGSGKETPTVKAAADEAPSPGPLKKRQRAS
mmetsp:Transcript_1204/g.3339  ORF Transcript_1204/g.3339 Transcript_1204/m.3339 type:complete len:388 (-) Transcript_1204:228-1391(-)